MAQCWCALPLLSVASSNCAWTCRGCASDLRLVRLRLKLMPASSSQAFFAEKHAPAHLQAPARNKYMFSGSAHQLHQAIWPCMPGFLSPPCCAWLALLDADLLAQCKDEPELPGLFGTLLMPVSSAKPCRLLLELSGPNWRSTCQRRLTTILLVPWFLSRSTISLMTRPCHQKHSKSYAELVAGYLLQVASDDAKLALLPAA